MSQNSKTKIKPLVVRPNEGRVYPMGRMSAIFKADGNETTNTNLSVSEWWLEPNTGGPDNHDHSEDHLFYVIEGSLSVYLEEKWLDAESGSYVYIPGGYTHGFENRSDKKVGFISINTPGGFEKSAPHIVSYFEENPLGDASAST